MKKKGNCVTTVPMMAAAVASALACGQTAEQVEQWRCFLGAVMSNLTLILVHCDLDGLLDVVEERIDDLQDDDEEEEEED